MKPSKPPRVLMIHQGRVGSTVLGDLLNQHSNICWDGELLLGPSANSPDLHPVTIKPEHRYCHTRFFPHAPYDFIADQMGQSEKPIYGFEVKFFQLFHNHLNTAAFVDRLEQMGFEHFILLRRRNYLRQLISFIVAANRDRWHMPTRMTADLTRISIDPTRVVMTDADRPLYYLFKDWDAQFRNLELAILRRRILSAFRRPKVLRLFYEDDIAEDPSSAYRKVCTFLGIQQEQPEIRLAKTNPFSVRDIVTNFDAVEKALAGTKYEWMLYR